MKFITKLLTLSILLMLCCMRLMAQLINPLNLNPMPFIPQDDLSYAVLIKVPGMYPASGFFINLKDSVFLVTAKHVLLNSASNPVSDSFEIIAYTPKSDFKLKSHMNVSLKMAERNGFIRSHPTEDVLALAFASITQKADTLSQILLLPHIVSAIKSEKGALIGVPLTHTRDYANTFIGNDIIIIGYPTSVGDITYQFDKDVPLLRKGIIGGKNDSLHTIILDCPVYYGNSGSPIIQIEREIDRIGFFVVGIVSQWVPFDSRIINKELVYDSPFRSNSGYSVGVPIETVIKMLEK